MLSLSPIYFSALFMDVYYQRKVVVVVYLNRIEVKCVLSLRLFCDPIDSSPPGSSVHGILQARILE